MKLLPLSLLGMAFKNLEIRNMGERVAEFAKTKGLTLFKEQVWFIDQIWTKKIVRGPRGCGVTFLNVLLMGYLDSIGQKVVWLSPIWRLKRSVEESVGYYGIKLKNSEILYCANNSKTEIRGRRIFADVIIFDDRESLYDWDFIHPIFSVKGKRAKILQTFNHERPYYEIDGVRFGITEESKETFFDRRFLNSMYGPEKSWPKYPNCV